MMCQSIISALACALGHVTFACSRIPLCQSIISALACALRMSAASVHQSAGVSVDHQRAGLRARGNLALIHPPEIRCQSIISALACALSQAWPWRPKRCMCQSIISALACALSSNDAYNFQSISVSRSSARWPAR